jgi:tetratricopeptide (TPR) repeat protein
MPLRVIDLPCPGCGAPSSTAASACMYCGRQVVISSFSNLIGLGTSDLKKYASAYKVGLQQAPDDPTLNSALGMCYLKLGLYADASSHFCLAMDDDIENSETYFYAAVALLEGKKAFVASMATVRKCEEYLEAAVRLEPRGVYYLMLAYLAYDYDERKCLNRRATYRDYLGLAAAHHLTQTDTALLKEVLRQDALGFPA